MPSVRRQRRPTGAFKLLTYLSYGSYPSLLINRGDRILDITSIRKLARLLGADTTRLNRWLAWLEDNFYLEQVTWAASKRSCRIKLRRPPNV